MKRTIIPFLTLVAAFAASPGHSQAVSSPSEQEAAFMWVQGVGEQVGYGAYCKLDRTLLDDVRKRVLTRIDAGFPVELRPSARARFDYAERAGYSSSAYRQIDCTPMRYGSGFGAEVKKYLVDVAASLTTDR